MAKKIIWTPEQTNDVLRQALLLKQETPEIGYKQLWLEAQKVLSAKYHRTMSASVIYKLKRLAADYVPPKESPPKPSAEKHPTNFCPGCGRQMPQISATINYCPACGFDLKPFNA